MSDKETVLEFEDEEQKTEEAPEVEEADSTGKPREAATEEPQETTEEKPEGWDKVDFKQDPPEKIEARFNRLYGQMKWLERSVDELAQQNQALVKLTQEEKRELAEANKKTRTEQLEQEIEQAQLYGDYKKSTQLMRELLKTENQQEQPDDRFEKTVEEVKQTNQQAQEKAEKEALEKLNAYRERHPLFSQDINQWKRALQYADELHRSSPGKYDVDQIIQRIDREFSNKNINNTEKGQTPPSVLNGQGQNAVDRGKKTIRLTPAQQNVAVKMYPDLQTKEAYKRYASQLGTTKRIEDI